MTLRKLSQTLVCVVGLAVVSSGPLAGQESAQDAIDIHDLVDSEVINSGVINSLSLVAATYGNPLGVEVGDVDRQRLGGELYLYARTTGFPNRIVQNALFDLTPPVSPTRVLFAPDIAIRRTGAPSTWAVPQEAPLLVVEVISPAQTLAEIALKAQTYRNAGVEEVWVVDARSRSVQVWTAQSMTTLDETQALTSPLLPGFSVPVRFLVDG
jgi:Uma2 family endonuclease